MDDHLILIAVNKTVRNASSVEANDLSLAANAQNDVDFDDIVPPIEDPIFVVVVNETRQPRTVAAKDVSGNSNTTRVG